MSKLQILAIDLKMPISDFEQESEEFVRNYSNNYGYDMAIGIKPMRTIHGKNMFKIEIKNDTSDNFTIVAEQDDISGDIVFAPLKFSNMNDGFYSSSCDPSKQNTAKEPAIFWNSMMENMSLTHEGTYASVSDSETILIKEGNRRQKAVIALVDTDGEVYSCLKAKNISGEQDDVEFTVRTSIAEWLGENTEVAAAISRMTSVIDKMNYIGKYLVAARLNDEIDSDEFVDIFRQAGVIGFSDASILSIYKLLM